MRTPTTNADTFSATVAQHSTLASDKGQDEKYRHRSATNIKHEHTNIDPEPNKRFPKQYPNPHRSYQCQHLRPTPIRVVPLQHTPSEFQPCTLMKSVLFIFQSPAIVQKIVSLLASPVVGCPPCGTPCAVRGPAACPQCLLISKAPPPEILVSTSQRPGWSFQHSQKGLPPSVPHHRRVAAVKSRNANGRHHDSQQRSRQRVTCRSVQTCQIQRSRQRVTCPPGQTFQIRISPSLLTITARSFPP